MCLSGFLLGVTKMPDQIIYALRYTICALSLNLRIDSSLGSQARSEVFVGI